MKRVTCPYCGWMYVDGQLHSFCPNRDQPVGLLAEVALRLASPQPESGPAWEQSK